KSAQIREILINESAWEEMTCLFAPSLSPSLPVKKDGPGKAIIVILSALIGGMVACGGVLLRYAMASRKQDAMMADHLV
ncbi:hypothetical protein ABN084_09385, partial [Escherichia coli]